MIKILYGVQIELIESFIKNYIKKQNINDVIKINYEEVTIDSVIEESSYINLFCEKKVIVLYNCTFLTGKEALDNKTFDKYLSKPNPNTTLFLVTYSEKLDDRKKIVKQIKSNYEVIEFNKFTEYDAKKYVSNSFENDGYEISEATIKKIVEYLSLNFGLYDNEINKLKLYKYEDKIIELKDVLDITSVYPEDDVFKLVDAVINNEKENIFSLFYDIKTLGMDEVVLLGLLSSAFRFLYQVSILMKEGKTKQDIISILSAHPYKTEVTMKKASNIKEEKLLDIMLKMANVDINIKSGEVDKTAVMEDFFLNL